MHALNGRRDLDTRKREGERGREGGRERERGRARERDGKREGDLNTDIDMNSDRYAYESDGIIKGRKLDGQKSRDPSHARSSAERGPLLGAQWPCSANSTRQRWGGLLVVGGRRLRSLRPESFVRLPPRWSTFTTCCHGFVFQARLLCLLLMPSFSSSLDSNAFETHKMG